jgi:hypothetical protein
MRAWFEGSNFDITDIAHFSPHHADNSHLVTDRAEKLWAKKLATGEVTGLSS